MKTYIRLFGIISVGLFLSSCSTMQKDCTSLSGDRDAYRDCMAVQGDQASQYELGIAAYEVEDYKTAIKWFERAARPRAYQLPDYLDPVEKSRNELTFEEDIAPEVPGHSGAQRMLVRIYEQGIGVPVNLKQANRYREMLNPQ